MLMTSTQKKIKKNSFNCFYSSREKMWEDFGTPQTSLTHVDQVLKTCLAFSVNNNQVIAPYSEQHYVLIASKIWFGWAKMKASLTPVELSMSSLLLHFMSCSMLYNHNMLCNAPCYTSHMSIFPEQVIQVTNN